MPVGDAEDQKRYEQYEKYLLYAQRAEDAAIAESTPQYLRRAKLDEAQEWRARAAALFH